MDNNFNNMNNLNSNNINNQNQQNSVYLKKEDTNNQNNFNNQNNYNNQNFNNNNDFSIPYVEQPVPIPVPYIQDSYYPPLTVTEWIYCMIVPFIPFIGIFLTIYFAVTEINPNKRNFFRATLAIMAILFFVGILVFLLLLSSGIAFYKSIMPFGV